MRYILIIVIATISQTMFAQVNFEFKSGVASYGLKDMKSWQEGVTRNSQFNLSVVESFPTYVAFQGNLLIESSEYQLGVGFSYFSTGGRLGYWDDTGSIIEDQLIKKFGAHMITSYQVVQNKRFIIDLRSHVVMNFTNLELNSIVSILQDSASESALFTSVNFTFIPSFDFKYSLGKGFGLTISIGGEIEPFKQELKYTENKEVALGFPDGSRAVKLGWNGFRALGGIYFSLANKSTQL